MRRAAGIWTRQRQPGDLAGLGGLARLSMPNRLSKLSRLNRLSKPSWSRRVSGLTQHAEAGVRWPDSLVTLAIETSCDDTCVAVLEKEKERGTGAWARARLLFEERITADNRAFGGIHPLTATESHMATLGSLVQRATARLPAWGEDQQQQKQQQKQNQRRPDFVSVTRGPGMASSLATGLAVAKGLAVAWDVPLVGVHHMQAHALTPRLVSALGATINTEDEVRPATFPYLSLLVSGGHTLLLHSRSLTDHRIIATAANIAIGDLLDKSARAILPRGYISAAEAAAGRSLPYGALLESFASGGEADQAEYIYPAKRCDEMAPFDSGRGWRLEAPLATGVLRRALRFDFSGLNGAAIKLAGGDGRGGADNEKAAGLADDKDVNEADKADEDRSCSQGLPEDERRLLARGTMQLAFEHLASRLLLALESGVVESVGGEAPTCLVVAGGVASNGFLRRVLRSALDVRGFGHLPLVAPPPALCTDNAAMIAWAGMEMFEDGWRSGLGVLPLRRWAMDAAAADGGILGVDGWKRGSSVDG